MEEKKEEEVGGGGDSSSSSSSSSRSGRSGSNRSDAAAAADNDTGHRNLKSSYLRSPHPHPAVYRVQLARTQGQNVVVCKLPVAVLTN